MWSAFHHWETFRLGFSAEECERVIALYQGMGAVQSRMPQADGAFIRDSELFWIPRPAEPEWIFPRIWEVVARHNSRDGFEAGGRRLNMMAAGSNILWAEER